MSQLPLSAQARVALAQLGIDYTGEELRRAAKNGDLTVVELFVLAGMDVDARNNRGFTALYWAAMECHLPVVKFLLEKGADFGVLEKENIDWPVIIHAKGKTAQDVFDFLQSFKGPGPPIRVVR